MRVPALLVAGVLGAGAGCNRPNPGFDVAPEPAASSSSAGTTELPTSEPPVLSTSESSGEQLLSTSAGSTSSSTTAGEESSSTGTPVATWPLDCAEPVRTRAATAVADTFFLNLPEGGGQCFNVEQDCENVSLGKMPTFQVYYTDSGDQVPPTQEYGGVFAARFEGPLVPLFEDTWEVPPEAFLGVEVSVTVARSPDNLKEWEPVDLRVYRMPEAPLLWDEGDNQVLAVCGKGDPSFRCQICAGKLEMPWECTTEWTLPGLFVKDQTVQTVQVSDDPMDGAAAAFEISAGWEWLLEDGFLLVPAGVLLEETLEVRTREFAMGTAGPFLSVVHCPPEF